MWKKTCRRDLITLSLAFCLPTSLFYLCFPPVSLDGPIPLERQASMSWWAVPWACASCQPSSSRRGMRWLEQFLSVHHFACRCCCPLTVLRIAFSLSLALLDCLLLDVSLSGAHMDSCWTWAALFQKVWFNQVISQHWARHLQTVILKDGSAFSSAFSHSKASSDVCHYFYHTHQNSFWTSSFCHSLWHCQCTDGNRKGHCRHKL